MTVTGCGQGKRNLQGVMKPERVLCAQVSRWMQACLAAGFEMTALIPSLVPHASACGERRCGQT